MSRSDYQGTSAVPLRCAGPAGARGLGRSSGPMVGPWTEGQGAPTTWLDWLKPCFRHWRIGARVICPGPDPPMPKARLQPVKPRGGCTLAPRPRPNHRPARPEPLVHRAPSKLACGSGMEVYLPSRSAGHATGPDHPAAPMRLARPTSPNHQHRGVGEKVRVKFLHCALRCGH